MIAIGVVNERGQPARLMVNASKANEAEVSGLKTPVLVAALAIAGPASESRISDVFLMEFS